MCDAIHIDHWFTSIAHPQVDSQVEATNKVILHDLHTRIADLGGSWLDEFSNVLWSLCTTPQEVTGETPYSLVYATEAMLPIEIGLPSIRSHLGTTDNDTTQAFDLDLLEEWRLQVEHTMAKDKLSATRFYNKQVKHKQFTVGD